MLSNQIYVYDILGALSKKLNINYLNYSQYFEDEIIVYRSGLPESYQKFLNDEGSTYPLLAALSAGQNQLLKWEDYCSKEYLEYCRKTYQQHPSGVCIVLQHQNFAEHIALGSSNPDVNLFIIFSRNSALKCRFIMTIRNGINQSIDDKEAPRSHPHNIDLTDSITSLTKSSRLRLS